MNSDLPWIRNQHLALFDVSGAEIHQNVDHKKKVYDEICVEKRVGLRIPTFD